MGRSGVDGALGVGFSEVIVGGEVDVDRSLPKSADSERVIVLSFYNPTCENQAIFSLLLQCLISFYSLDLQEGISFSN